MAVRAVSPCCRHRSDEWLPKDHLARFVVDIVEQLDLSALIGRYRGGAGSAAYRPVMLLALLIYGYATGRARKTV